MTGTEILLVVTLIPLFYEHVLVGWEVAEYTLDHFCFGSNALIFCLCKDSRLNNNSLTGTIPMTLTTIQTLQVL